MLRNSEYTVARCGSMRGAAPTRLPVACKRPCNQTFLCCPRCPPGSNVIDAEYLKNTVIKLFVTGEAEALLPVFATILSFSPAEVQRCREGLAAIKRVGGDGGGLGREERVEGLEAGHGPCGAR